MQISVVLWYPACNYHYVKWDSSHLFHCAHFKHTPRKTTGNTCEAVAKTNHAWREGPGVFHHHHHHHHHHHSSMIWLHLVILQGLIKELHLGDSLQQRSWCRGGALGGKDGTNMTTINDIRSCVVLVVVVGCCGCCCCFNFRTVTLEK